MKTGSLFLTLFFLICFSLNAQNDAFSQHIQSHLESSGTLDTSSATYNEVLTLLQRNFDESDVPPEVWDDLSDDKEQQMETLEESMTQTYRAYFSEEDIVALNKHFESDAVRQLESDPDKLSPAQQETIANFHASDLGMKLSAKQKQFKGDAKTLSEEWRKELFMKKMGTLVKLGYRN